LGSEIEVTVTVQIVGADGTNSWWCSTEYALWCPETGMGSEGCVHEPSPTGGCYCNWGCLEGSWKWESTFSTQFTITAPTVAGTYDVTLCAVTQEDACGSMDCNYPTTFTDAITVTCGPDDIASVEAGSPRVLTCTEPSVTLTATASGGTAPYTFLWTPGSLRSQSITVDAAGTYTVKVTGGNGCSSTDSVAVTEDKAAPSVEAGDPQVLTCAGPSATLTATASGGTAPYTFLWTPGDLTSESITVNTAGTYTVKVTGGNGCSASDSVVVSGLEQWTDFVVNGGFERGLDGWRLYPESNGPTATAFSATTPSFPSAAGTTCLQTGTAYLQGYAVDPSNPTVLVQDVTAVLRPGHTYRLSGWIWSDEAGSTRPVIALHYVMSDGTTTPGGVAAELGLPAANRVPGQWTYCQSGEFVHEMPAGCTQTWLVLAFVNSVGYGWWDDISLMELGD
jgi:hypothetical protein